MPGTQQGRGALHLRIAPDGARTVELRLWAGAGACEVWRLDALRRSVAAPAPDVLRKSFRPEGSRHFLALEGGVAATRKADEDPGWIDVDGELVAEDGRDLGHLLALARFHVEPGSEREWFLYGVDVAGILRAESDQVALVREFLPQALDASAVAPAGVPGLPGDLVAHVPLALRWWEKSGPEASAARSELIASGILGPQAVALVDGRYEVVAYVPSLVVPAPARAEKSAEAGSAAAIAGRVAELAGYGGAVRAITAKAAPEGLPRLPDEDLVALDLRAAGPAAADAMDLAVMHPGEVVAVTARADAALLAKLGRPWAFRFPVREGMPADVAVATTLRLRDAAAHVDWLEDAAKLAYADFQGIKVVIDRPKGFVRRGIDPDGTHWERTYKLDYGYIAGTAGGDDEPLDVFLGPERAAPLAYFITQNKADGRFDEYKLMLGFADEPAACTAYADHIPKKLMGDVVAIEVGKIKALLGLEIGDVAKAVKALVAKPFGPYGDFDACLADQKSKGHDEDSARAICGKLQAELEGKAAAPVGKAVVVKLLPPKDAKGDERYALGIVLEPDPVIDGKVGDLQGDTYNADEIRGAAFLYMTDFRNMGLMHQQLVNEHVQLLESYVWPETKCAACGAENSAAVGGRVLKPGTWLMAVRYLADDLWEKVKSGVLNGFSIGGDAIRRLLRPGD